MSEVAHVCFFNHEIFLAPADDGLRNGHFRARKCSLANVIAIAVHFFVRASLSMRGLFGDVVEALLLQRPHLKRDNKNN